MTTSRFDEFQINIGAKVKYKNRICEIESALTIDKVLLKDLDNWRVFAAKITDIQPADNVIFTDKVETNLTYLNDDLDWDEAKRREKIIGHLARETCSRFNAADVAKKLGISQRQVYKLVKKYRDSRFNITSLLPLAPVGGKGKGRLVKLVEQIIAATINELYLST